MTMAFVGLGANIDEPRKHVEQAITDLDAIFGTRVLRRSSLYRSAPLGYASQPWFVNAVAKLDTNLSATGLLRELQRIESRYGRQRSIPNGPRSLDLDLLLFDELVIRGAELTVPHPRMHERAFVLLPLAEIEPGLALPGLGKVAELAAACCDQDVERMQ